MRAAWTWTSSLRQALPALAFLALTAAPALPQAAAPQGLAIKAETAPLCALIGKQQVLALRYDYDPDTAEPRELEPYGVGYTRKGNILLFGRQVKGYSKSAEGGGGQLPGWRNFRVDRIKAGMVTALPTTFEPTRPRSGSYGPIFEFACRNDAAFDRPTR
jgi:WYL domain